MKNSWKNEGWKEKKGEGTEKRQNRKTYHGKKGTSDLPSCGLEKEKGMTMRTPKTTESQTQKKKWGRVEKREKFL